MRYNPIIYTDPSGNTECQGVPASQRAACEGQYGQGSTTVSSPPIAPQPQMWFPPAGNKVEVNFSLGLTLNYPSRNNPKGKTTFLLYYAWSMVTDNKGGVQFYSTKRDQEYKGGADYTPGPAEKSSPSEGFTAGASVSYGAIEGKLFRDIGTAAYEEYAVNDSASVLVVGGDRYNYFNKITNKIEPEMMRGYDVALSVGSPVSSTHIATYSKPLTGRYEIPWPFYNTFKLLGLFGSYPLMGSSDLVPNLLPSP